MSDSENRPAGRHDQRDRLVAGAVQFATAHGIGSLSLRPLAADLATSDRMLIYYFGSRDGIIRAICDQLTVDLQRLLATSVPSRPLAPAALLAYSWDVVSDPRLRPTLALHLEIDALATRGVEPFAEAARAATTAWLDWLSTQLDSPADHRRAIASTLLAIIDGMLLQAAVCPAAPILDAQQWLGDLLGKH